MIGFLLCLQAAWKLKLNTLPKLDPFFFSVGLKLGTNLFDMEYPALIDDMMDYQDVARHTNVRFDVQLSISAGRKFHFETSAVERLSMIYNELLQTQLFYFYDSFGNLDC